MIAPVPYTLALASYAWGSRFFLYRQKERQWILSATVNSLVTLAGLYQTYYWWSTGDVRPSAGSDAIVDLLRAYLAVDLVYNGIYFAADMNPLEFWIHHICYLFFFYAIRAYGFSGVIRALYIMEAPSAIRAWGSIVPSWRYDAGFGMVFGALRIMLPFYVAVHVRAEVPLWGWPIFFLIQTLHFYWFYKWCDGQIRRMQIVARESCAVVG